MIHATAQPVPAITAENVLSQCWLNAAPGVNSVALSRPEKRAILAGPQWRAPTGRLDRPYGWVHRRRHPSPENYFSPTRFSEALRGEQDRPMETPRW